MAHLAFETALHFKLGQPELGISNEDLKVVEIAGGVFEYLTPLHTATD